MNFFDELSEISAKIPRPGVDAFLEKYSAMNIDSLEMDNIVCRDFLFQENLVWKSIDDHKIVVPGYCVDRSGFSEVVDFISNGEPLCFIAGNFFSGKTLFLIEVAKYFMSKKVYVFPSGVKLTDTQLGALMEKTNALIETPHACKALVEDVKSLIAQKMELGIISGTPGELVFADKPKLMLILAYRSRIEKQGFEQKMEDIIAELPPHYMEKTKVVYYDMLSRLEDK